jgi:hypothetical protein
VCVGAIPISRENFSLLCERRRRKVISDTFQSLASYREFEAAKRDVKIRKLRLAGIGVAISLKSLFARPPLKS